MQTEKVRNFIYDSQANQRWRQAIQSFRAESILAQNAFEKMRTGQENLCLDPKSRKLIQLDASEKAYGDLYDNQHKLTDQGYKKLLFDWQIARINQLLSEVFPKFSEKDAHELCAYIKAIIDKDKDGIQTMPASLNKFLDKMEAGSFKNFEEWKEKKALKILPSKEISIQEPLTNEALPLVQKSDNSPSTYVNEFAIISLMQRSVSTQQKWDIVAEEMLAIDSLLGNFNNELEQVKTTLTRTHPSKRELGDNYESILIKLIDTLNHFNELFDKEQKNTSKQRALANFHAVEANYKMEDIEKELDNLYTQSFALAGQITSLHNDITGLTGSLMGFGFSSLLPLAGGSTAIAIGISGPIGAIVGGGIAIGVSAATLISLGVTLGALKAHLNFVESRLENLDKLIAEKVTKLQRFRSAFHVTLDVEITEIKTKLKTLKNEIDRGLETVQAPVRAIQSASQSSNSLKIQA